MIVILSRLRLLIRILPAPAPPPPAKGRASLEKLQAEADRISAQVASPIADKLSAGGVSKETGSSAGQSAAAAAAGSHLSEAFGRGRDGVLAAVGEAGRAVDRGVSAVSSRSAVVVDGLPALKGQASGLSARVGAVVGEDDRGSVFCFLFSFSFCSCLVVSDLACCSLERTLQIPVNKISLCSARLFVVLANAADVWVCLFGN